MDLVISDSFYVIAPRQTQFMNRFMYKLHGLSCIAICDYDCVLG